jgi:L-ascorbate metabolism protein UlaG (beta-lactamase superfamily)
MTLLDRVFRRWDPPAALRPEGAPLGDALAIRWLGTAGFRLSLGGKTLLLDPFVTRPRLRAHLRRLSSDAAAVARWAPAADAIAIGHAHYDHVLDAPSIARKTGAVVLGSRSVARFALASGVEAARVRSADSRGLLAGCGPFEVRLVPSLHAKLLLGIAPPFPGEIRGTPRFFNHFRSGRPHGIFVRAGGVSVYHNGSADLVDAALDGLKADVLLVGVAGWRVTAHYLERLVRHLSPRVIVPTHYDAYFFPLEDGVRLLPGVGLEEFIEKARSVAPDATVVVPRLDEELVLDATRFGVRRARE